VDIKIPDIGITFNTGFMSGIFLLGDKKVETAYNFST